MLVKRGLLLAVLPIARTIDLERAGEIIVVSIELWEDGIVLHTVEPLRTRGLRSGTTPRRPRWTVTDDTGTDYEPGLFASGRWLGGRLRRAFGFVPSVPSGATHLTLEREGASEGQSISVAIPDRDPPAAKRRS